MTAKRGLRKTVLCCGALALLAVATAVQATDVQAADTVNDWIAGLASPDAKIRVESARQLWRNGHDAKAAVEPLLKALADTDPMERAYAARALGTVGQATPEVMAGLAARLADQDPRVSDAAADSIRLLAIEPNAALPDMASLPDSVNPQLMVPVIEAIVSGGEREVPRLIAALKEKRLRFWAAVALDQLGPVGKAAVPALQEALQDPRPEVRLQVAIALGQMGPAAAPAIDALIPLLKAKEAGVQYAAAFALANIASPKAITPLRELSKTSDPFLKVLAVWGVAKSAPNDANLVKKAVAFLAESLSSKDDRVRQAAARGLAELKADPKLVDALLIKKLDDPDPAVRANVVDAIASVGPAIVPRLATALGEPKFRLAAVQAIRKIGEGAKAAGPALQSAIKAEIAKGNSADNQFLSEALVAVSAIGAANAAMIPEMTALLKSDEPTVQRGATFVLGRIGPPAKDIVSQLEAQLQSDDPPTRLVSLWALLQITPESLKVIEAAVPSLTQALADPREMVRREAAAALGRTGKHAKGSVTELKKLLDDPEPSVRESAKQAIEAIEAG